METLILHITDLSRGGAGVSRDSSGRVIFVPLTMPGDEVRVRVVDSKKRFANAELIEIIQPAPDRVRVPPCAIFGRCGGCQWQHVPYPLQWKTKVSGVHQALKRALVSYQAASWNEFPAQKIYEYRNRIQLRGSGGELGFYSRGTHELVSAERCEISRPEINAGWEETRSQALKLSASTRYKVEVEVLPEGSLRRTWNAPHGAAGFRQVNDEQNARLKSWIQEVLRPYSGSVLYDLFGGSGNLSLQFQDSMKMIHCVDVSSPEIAPEGTAGHFKFHRSPVDQWISKHAKQPKEPSSGQLTRIAILDPPREGLGESFDTVSQAMEKLEIHHCIAVGCDPDSWARDVSHFQARGWKLEKAAVFDFFPQTPHVESAGLLTRN